MRATPLLLVLLAPWAFAQDVEFYNEELLFNPTATSVTLTAMPREEVDLVVRYDGRLTAPQRVRAGVRATFVLDDLAPGEEYTYRLGVKRPFQGHYTFRDEHRFRTLRPRGSTFSFAVLADPHPWAMWTRAKCDIHPQGLAVLRQTLTNVRDDPDLDFVLLGTDVVVTKCGNACIACDVDGTPTSAKNVNSLLEAELRYRTAYSPAIYGILGADVPMLSVLGDHDGELGWNLSGIPGWSRRARLTYTPNPFPSYGGGPAGTYYSLETGDLLIVVLDPIRTTEIKPESPFDWTLGERQLRWLERVLSESDATFKLVTAEHLVGGANPQGLGIWKARGSLKATHNGEINGTFLGEQFEVHELLKAWGAQMFLSFHDHLVVWGEKVDDDFVGEGVTYIVGGQGADDGKPPWATDNSYAAEMDYDNDGVPEYMTGTNGSTLKGHFKVTVTGSERVDFDYIRSAFADPDKNGTVVLGFTITPDGRVEAKAP